MKYILLSILFALLLVLAGISQALSQTLWGMASEGGSKGGGGNIFSLNTDGTGFQERYAFLADGNGTYHQPMLDYGDGFLYTVCGFGGVAGEGMLYRMHPDGTAYQPLYHFKRETGYLPYASVIKGLDGMLYGTTSQGGVNSSGMIYRINTNGSGFQIIHVFTGTDGSFSTAALVQLSNGDLYGATENGGLYDKGTLYKIKPDGTGFQSLHWFNGTGGQSPDHLLPITIGSTSYIYGTTWRGGSYNGGVLFRIKTDGSSFLIQQHFHGSPRGTITKIGSILYGVAGSTYPGYSGQVYGFNLTTGILQTLKLFELENTNTTAEFHPMGITAVNGVLCGVTEGGGIFNNGVLFKLNTNGTGYTILKHQTEGTDFFTLSGYNGQVYGATHVTAASNHGTVYRINTDGTGFQSLHVYNSPDGYKPTGSLIKAQDGNLYGVAGYNETAISPGWAFRIKTDGTGFTRLLDLYNISGGSQGSLLQASNGSFYGMNNDGGASFSGNIFKFTQGSSFISSQIFNVFNPAPGAINHPNGSLLQGIDGKLYGMASMSHSEEGGIFRMATDGSAFSVMHFFTGSDGANPHGSLIHDATGTLYGMTENGGSQDWGVIFKINPITNVQQVIFTFGNFGGSSTNGVHPKGSLLLAADNKLYGMAYGGGSSFSGTIFRLNTDGSGFQVIHHFNYTDGALPNGSLIIDNNTGFLYGTTERGGSSDMGIVFRIKQDGSLFQKLFNFNGSNGKYPKGDLLLLPPTGAKTASRYFNTSEKSIPAITAAIVDVFPNPVQHAFMLHCKQPAAGQIIYSVADIKGKLIRQQTISHASTDLYQQVDITALPAGIYILKVTMQAQLFTKKIVKQ